VKQEETAVARGWGDKHVSVATNKLTKIKELYGVAFSLLSLLRIYNEYQQQKHIVQATSISHTKSWE
jgi:hypothetical protein